MKISKNIVLLSIFFSFAFACTFHNSYAASCGGVNTSLINCENGDNQTFGGVGSLLKEGVKIMNWLVVALAVAGVAYGAVLYTTAGGNSEQTKKAISYIRNVAIGLILWGLMYAILNWLVPVPGGFKAF